MLALLRADEPTPDLSSASDTGSSDSDDLTGEPTPTFTGTAEADSTVEVFSDGSSLGTTTSDSDGNWSFTPNSDLELATHSITATVIDIAGNVSDASS